MTQTCLPVPVDRYLPPEAVADMVRVIEGSGVVDDMLLWDQLTHWWPQALWTEENTHLASWMKDSDSFADVFVMAGYLHAAAPRLGTVISTDALRRGPAELTQTMLTVANLTGGRSVFQIGAGEFKQAQPFGHRRSEGLARWEDLFRTFHKFWDTDGPISHEGNKWTLDEAWIGLAKPHRPKLWALGGGPKLLDLTTSFADGFSSMSPYVWRNPEHAHEVISELKQGLEAKGRDVASFDFGLWPAVLIHDDEDVIKEAMRNPLLTWMTACFGRLPSGEWTKEGIEPIFPLNWHYAMKLLPVKWTKEECLDVCAKVSPEMARKSWIAGTPAQVAAELQRYVDAGVTWMAPCDILPVVTRDEDPQDAIARSIEVCRILKAPEQADTN
jgi:phthiodiolone/phenolphthiodiolone dimycocerosates ketoreductase